MTAQLIFFFFYFMYSFLLVYVNDFSSRSSDWTQAHAHDTYNLFHIFVVPSCNFFSLDLAEGVVVRIVPNLLSST